MWCDNNGEIPLLLCFSLYFRWASQPLHFFAGVFSLGVPVDALFFIGNQLVATSHTGKVGVWNAVTQHWQVCSMFHITFYKLECLSSKKRIKSFKSMWEMLITGFSAWTCVMEFITWVLCLWAECCLVWCCLEVCFLGFQMKGCGVVWSNKCQVPVYLNFFMDY